VGPKVTATDRHPFWVASRNAWVDAAHLQPGDILLTDDGQTVLVEYVSRYSVAVQTVHNFTVEGIHTYLVGEEVVLVHNCGTTTVARP
jgi:hypothetical protein